MKTRFTLKFMIEDNPVFDSLSSIFENGFNVYLPLVTLQKEENTISGVGHLFQNKGKFILKLINSAPPSKIKESHNFLKSLDNKKGSGKQRSQMEHCYKMEATDVAGNRYTCKNVDAGNDYNRSLYDCEFKSEILIESDEHSTPDINVACIEFKNKYS